ncbi:MAG: sensor domain-containing diguanylate cyclase [bacterium]|nr:sensor domain-containing diguanylate cyclase [bacterium]
MIEVKEKHLKILTVVIAVILTYIIISLTYTYSYRYEIKKFEYYTFYAVAFYTLIIISSWFLMGNIIGSTIAGLSVAIAVFVAAVFQRWEFLSNCFAFIAVCLSLYGFCNRQNHEISDIKIKTGDISETANTLAKDFQKENLWGESLDRKLLRISKLRVVSKDIGVSLTKGEFIKKVIKNTIQIIQKPGVYQLYLLTEDMRTMELMGLNAYNVKSDDFTYFEKDDLNQWIFRNRQPVHISDLNKDFRFGRKYGSLAKSIIASPLISDNKIMGILKINNEVPEVYSVDDLRILSIIANLSALAFSNSQLYETTRLLAIKDGLTGLFTAGYFRQKIAEYVKQDAGKPLSLIMMDIDDFKQFNDKYGHVVGDIVLRKTAGEIQAIIGQKGIAARYGGEEFACILPGISDRTAFDFAGKICASISSSEETIRENKIRVTISAGVASMVPVFQSAEDLIEAADNSLYDAKRQGKNRAVLWEKN